MEIRKVGKKMEVRKKVKNGEVKLKARKRIKQGTKDGKQVARKGKKEKAKRTREAKKN